MKVTQIWESAAFPLLMPMHFFSASYCTIIVNISSFCRFFALLTSVDGST